MKDKIEEIENKIKKIQADLLEQEHRPFKLIWNYFNRKNKWHDKKDHRRKAVTKAIIWRFLISPTTIAIATSGLLGYFSLFFMYKQTSLFENQNKLFELQNKRIEQQTHLAEASRRSTQMFIMGEVLSDVNNELNDPSNKKKILSKTLVGRIIGLSHAMKPYKFLVRDSLIEKALSPERGQLLMALSKSKMDSAFYVDEILAYATFENADLSNMNFKNSILVGINLEGSKLNRTNLIGAKLKNANLKNTNLKEVYSLMGTDLSNVDLSNMNLKNVDLMGSNLTGTDLIDTNLKGVDFSVIQSLHGATVLREDWLTYIRDSLRVFGSDEIYNNYEIVCYDYPVLNHADQTLEYMYRNIDIEYIYVLREKGFLLPKESGFLNLE